MAAIRYRVNELHADRITYVVGSEQSQHLAMVIAVARQAGWLPDSVRAEHAPIGMVTGADRKRFRSRSGESVKLIDLIDEAVARADKVIEDRYDDPHFRAQIAQAVGIGALKYADLSVARDSSYVLDFDRMLTLTGNTGPYLQYATARIRSIFHRSDLRPEDAAAPVILSAPADPTLAARQLRQRGAVGGGPRTRRDLRRRLRHRGRPDQRRHQPAVRGRAGEQRRTDVGRRRGGCGRAWPADDRAVGQHHRGTWQPGRPG